MDKKKDKKDKQWDKIKDTGGTVFGGEGDVISGGDNVNTTLAKDCYKECHENEVVGWTQRIGLPSVIKYCQKAIGGLKKICVDHVILPNVADFGTM